MSKRKLTYKDFKEYFSNNLMNKEKHAFEKKMMQDAFEEEAFDGLSQLKEDEFEKDIAELKGSISEKVSGKRHIVPVWFRYAASIIVILGIGYSVLKYNQLTQKKTFNDELELAEELAEENLPVTKQAVEPIREAEEKVVVSEKDQELIAEQAKPPVPARQEKLLVVDDEVEIDDELIAEAEDLEADEKEIFIATETDEVDIVTYEMAEEEAARDIAGVQMKAVGARGSDSVSKEGAGYFAQLEAEEATLITGKVVSKSDSASLQGVNIYVYEDPTNYAVTNSKGEFEMEVPKDDELKNIIASYSGMEDQIVSIEADTNLIVMLDESKMELEKVVSAAYSEKKARRSKSAPSIKDGKASPPNYYSLKEFAQYIEKEINNNNYQQYIEFKKITLFITINSDGTPTNFDFRENLDEILINKIVQVIQDQGMWSPAIINGQRVNSVVKISLKF